MWHQRQGASCRRERRVSRGCKTLIHLAHMFVELVNYPALELPRTMYRPAAKVQLSHLILQWHVLTSGEGGHWAREA